MLTHDAPWNESRFRGLLRICCQLCLSLDTHEHSHLILMNLFLTLFVWFRFHLFRILVDFESGICVGFGSGVDLEEAIGTEKSRLPATTRSLRCLFV